MTKGRDVQSSNLAQQEGFEDQVTPHLIEKWPQWVVIRDSTSATLVQDRARLHQLKGRVLGIQAPQVNDADTAQQIDLEALEAELAAL